MALDRPTHRGDCLPGGSNEQRPCPWVSCRYHTAVQLGGGRPAATKAVARQQIVKLRLAHEALAAGHPSCALDVADLGPQGNATIAAVLGISREYSRRTVAEALAANPDLKDLIHDRLVSG